MKQILNAGIDREGEVLKNELNTVERNMYKSLINHPEDNLEKRWKRGHGYFLVGRKETNPHNGETKITFENVQIAESLEPLKPLEIKKEPEPAITEKILREKVAELDRAIEVMKQRRDAWKMLFQECFKKEE